MVTQPAPPQTRTCAINASGSSGKALYYSSVVSWGIGDTIGELKVSLVGQPTTRFARCRLPSRGSLASHFPTLAGTMRHYDCPLSFSGRFTRRWLPDTLSAFSALCSLRLVARGESSHATPGLLVNRYPSSSGGGDKETAGSLQFPNYPSECMPRSQTPVVSHSLGITGIGLLPSGRCKPSAFPFTCANGYPYWTTTILISGLNPAACTLATPGSIPPLTGTPAGSLLTWCLPLVRSELLQLLGTHRLGNNDPFPGPICMAPVPRSRIYLDASSGSLGVGAWIFLLNFFG